MKIIFAPPSKNPRSAAAELKTICNELNIELENATIVKKSEWTKTAKQEIVDRIEQSLSVGGTKSRFVKSFGQKSYITDLDKANARKVLCFRLNMIELNENFKGRNVDNLCPMCDIELDSSEHIFDCCAYGDDCGESVLNDILQNDDVKKIKKV